MIALKILIACEFSGIVREAFIRRGFDAISCDLLPTEIPGPHYEGDVFDLIDTKHYDLMIAHPPCTHLAISGARHFHMKKMRQKRAVAFVKDLLDSPINHIALENPKSVISTKIRKADQYIQPWMFGHSETKTTGFWLKNLPKLKPTKIMENRRDNLTPTRQNKQGWTGRPLVVPRNFKNRPIKSGDARWMERNRTYSGIAEAMAIQWGNYITDQPMIQTKF